MSELVFLLEEASAEAMLRGLLPRLLSSDVTVRYVVFEGKSDLEAQLVRRLRHYRVPGARFIILRDKDAADCREVKRKLRELCDQSGKSEVLIRIACHELESWYLADLAAVERALKIDSLASKQRRAKFRNPDELANAAEELEALTKGVYQKVGGSREIGVHLDPTNTRSRSFAVFVNGIRKITANH